MENTVFLLIALIIGVSVVLIFNLLRRREARDVARELISETQSQRIEDLEAILGLFDQFLVDAGMAHKATHICFDDAEHCLFHRAPPFSLPERL